MDTTVTLTHPLSQSPNQSLSPNQKKRMKISMGRDKDQDIIDVANDYYASKQSTDEVEAYANSQSDD